MKYISLIFLVFSISVYSQSNKIVLGKSYAEKELRLALSNESQHNVVDNKSIIIKDSSTAIEVAEPILFSIYEKKTIVSEKPYETYLINNY